MFKRKTPARALPKGLQVFFPDKDHFQRFQERWALIEARTHRKPLDVARVLSVLRWAWAHATWERDLQTKLNTWGAEFLDRDTCLMMLMGKVRAELVRLFEEKKFHRLLDLAARRSRPVVWGANDLTGPVLLFQKNDPHEAAPTPDPDPVVLSRTAAPIWEAFEEFRHRLDAPLEMVRVLFHRPRGHQKQPWIIPAMHRLREAGLTKGEADELLRSMGLKGSDANEAVRQTISHR
jgi:hypothetical protein